jgi:hypothetical protein
MAALMEVGYRGDLFRLGCGTVQPHQRLTK